MKTKRFISILMTAVMMLSVVFCAVPTVGAETTKVTGLKQTSARRTSISFSWTTQLGVDYYEVQMKKSNSNNWVTMTKYAKGSDSECDYIVGIRKVPEGVDVCIKFDGSKKPKRKI